MIQLATITSGENDSLWKSCFHAVPITIKYNTTHDKAKHSIPISIRTNSSWFIIIGTVFIRTIVKWSIPLSDRSSTTLVWEVPVKTGIRTMLFAAMLHKLFALFCTKWFQIANIQNTDTYIQHVPPIENINLYSKHSTAYTLLCASSVILVSSSKLTCQCRHSSYGTNMFLHPPPDSYHSTVSDEAHAQVSLSFELSRLSYRRATLAGLSSCSTDSSQYGIHQPISS